jgi:hypothetical protein
MDIAAVRAGEVPAPRAEAPMRALCQVVEVGFENSAHLGATEADIALARERFIALRSRIEPLVIGARQIRLIAAITRVHRDGQEGHGLLVASDAAVVVLTVRRAALRAKWSAVIFPRQGLWAGVSDEGGRHAILLQADGRKLRFVLARPNPELEAGMLERANRHR